MMRRHSAKSMSSQATNGTMAASLTRMSTLSCRAITASTSPATSASSLTSTSWNSPPIAAAVSAAVAGLRSATTTFAPSALNFLAIARPIPCPAPVTMATRSASFNVFASFSLEWNGSSVVVRGALPGLESLHFVRWIDLRAALYRQALEALDRLDRRRRVQVEPGDDLSIEAFEGVSGVPGEQHRRFVVHLDEQRVMPSRVTRRLKQPDPVCYLDVAAHLLVPHAGVVEGEVGIAKVLEGLGDLGVAELLFADKGGGLGEEPVASYVVEVEVGVGDEVHLLWLETAEPQLFGEGLGFCLQRLFERQHSIHMVEVVSRVVHE